MSPTADHGPLPELEPDLEPEPEPSENPVLVPEPGPGPESEPSPGSTPTPGSATGWATAAAIEREHSIPSSTTRRWGLRRRDPVPSRQGPLATEYLVGEVLRRDRARREAGVPLGAPPGARPGGAPGDTGRWQSAAAAGGAVARVGGDSGGVVGDTPRDEPSPVTRVESETALIRAETARLRAEADHEEELARREMQRIMAHRRRQQLLETPVEDEPSPWERHVREVESLNERGQALQAQATLVAQDRLSTLSRRGLVAKDYVAQLARDVVEAMGLVCAEGCWSTDAFAEHLDDISVNLGDHVGAVIDLLIEERGVLPSSSRWRCP